MQNQSRGQYFPEQSAGTSGAWNQGRFSAQPEATGQQVFGQYAANEEVNEIEFMCDDGEPLQLVKFDRNTGEFNIEAKAAQVLSAVQGNVGFCSLAGKYRTGKSFLLNQLLCLKGQGVCSTYQFKVNPTVTACTEGIWIWSKPVFNTNENVNIFFLDTEGLDSVDGNPDHDAKIFALALLMSSYFMFNRYAQTQQCWCYRRELY